jgi:hypothetical protein
MKIAECVREYEVVESVGCGRWPDGCAELRAHVETCAVCTDVLKVALALHEDREIAFADAKIPSAGLVWWRAELRARQEAMRTAARPITVAQIFGAASAIAVASALLAGAWPWLKTMLVLPSVPTLSVFQWGIVIALGLAVFVVAPLAMYLALSDD